jgi:hypothetical protein
MFHLNVEPVGDIATALLVIPACLYEIYSHIVARYLLMTMESGQLYTPLSPFAIPFQPLFR